MPQPIRDAGAKLYVDGNWIGPFSLVGYDKTHSWDASLVDFNDHADLAEAEDPRTDRVQVLTERLAMHWADNPYAFRVSVLDQSEPNAFAIPGGQIVITRGLLESVSSESELAFVLGHEIGHFKQRDHLRGLGRGIALVIAISALDLGGAGGAHDLLSGATGIAGRRRVGSSLTRRRLNC